MVGVRVGVVVMAVVMIVVVVVIMRVVVVMVMMAVVVLVATVLAGQQTFDVMVVALLRRADLVLEAQHLGPVLAHLAVHQVLAVENLLDPVGEGVQQQHRVDEVMRVQEILLRMHGLHNDGVKEEPLLQD